MDLFRRDGRPRLVHLKTRREAGAVVITWDVRHAPAVRWRVLRSQDAPAAEPFDDAVVGRGQELISDRPAPGSRDDRPEPGATYFYTIFGEDERGRWLLLASPRVAVDASRLTHRAEGDFEAGETGRLTFRDAGSVKAAGAVIAGKARTIEGRGPH